MYKNFQGNQQQLNQNTDLVLENQALSKLVCQLKESCDQLQTQLNQKSNENITQLQQIDLMNGQINQSKDLMMQSILMNQQLNVQIKEKDEIINQLHQSQTHQSLVQNNHSNLLYSQQPNLSSQTLTNNDMLKSQQQINSMSNQLILLQNKLQSQVESNQQLKSINQQKEFQIAQLETQIDGFQQQTTLLKFNLDTKCGQLNDSQVIQQQLLEQIRELSRKQNQAQTHDSILQDQLQSKVLESRLNDIQQKYIGKEQIIQQLQQQVQNLNLQNEQLQYQMQNIALQQNSDDNETKLKLIQLQNAYNEQFQRNKAISVENTSLRQQNVEQLQQLAQLQKIIDDYNCIEQLNQYNQDKNLLVNKLKNSQAGVFLTQNQQSPKIQEYSEQQFHENVDQRGQQNDIFQIDQENLIRHSQQPSGNILIQKDQSLVESLSQSISQNHMDAAQKQQMEWDSNEMQTKQDEMQQLGVVRQQHERELLIDPKNKKGIDEMKTPEQQESSTDNDKSKQHFSASGSHQSAEQQQVDSQSEAQNRSVQRNPDAINQQRQQQNENSDMEIENSVSAGTSGNEINYKKDNFDEFQDNVEKFQSQSQTTDSIIQQCNQLIQPNSIQSTGPVVSNNNGFTHLQHENGEVANDCDLDDYYQSDSLIQSNQKQQIQQFENQAPIKDDMNLYEDSQSNPYQSVLKENSLQMSDLSKFSDK